MERLRRQAKLDKMRDLRRVRRRKIVIQRLVEGEDEWGNVVSEWTDWRELWADLESLWGQEYFAARAVNEQNTLVFVLRYAPFLDQLNTTHFRVLFPPREYDIVHIDRLHDDGMWIKLRCQERGAGG